MFIDYSKQGSDEWFKARESCVTASQAWKILPPKNDKKKDFLKSGIEYADAIVFEKKKSKTLKKEKFQLLILNGEMSLSKSQENYMN